MKEMTHQISLLFTGCISTRDRGTLPKATYWEERGVAAGSC